MGFWLAKRGWGRYLELINALFVTYFKQIVGFGCCKLNVGVGKTSGKELKSKAKSFFSQRKRTLKRIISQIKLESSSARSPGGGVGTNLV